MSGPWADVRETHTGVVFLVGDRAFKAKKPVDLGFCDFTSLAARTEACQREVALNRRLAPDVYLGVAELHLPESSGAEPVVVMRRMPAEARLSALAADSAIKPDRMRALARLLATFHERCESDATISAEATAGAVAARWTANLQEMEAFAGSILEEALLAEVSRLALEWIAGRGPLFQARVASGRIVDGHGDLLADDIFLLPDGPRVLDCLEFDDRLRYVDRIDDIAFLAMDLERLGADAAAAELVDAYREFGDDRAPDSLVHHYTAYRALVRAKVACVRHAQGDATSRETAGACLELAYRHLLLGSSRLVLVGGLPGTGKSTLAGALADRIGATVLSTDRVRKELAGLAAEDSAAAAFGQGLYTTAMVDAVYDEVLRRAGLLLEAGETVVLDGTWSARRHRDAAAALAARTHSTVTPLRCAAPSGVAAARMVGRVGPSDADPRTAAALADTAEQWLEAIVVDTAGSVEAACDDAFAVVFPRSAVQVPPVTPRAADAVRVAPAAAESVQPRRCRAVELDHDRALTLLSSRSPGFGRLAFAVYGAAHIEVVNFLLDAGEVVFRIDAGAKLIAVGHGGHFAFQIDQIDPVTRSGWTVTAVGPVHRVHGPEAERLTRALTPWVGGDKRFVMRLTPRRVFGRLLEAN
ncbi:MAG: AAA family ATPase [Sporichthyaceae bacterium]